MSVKCSTNDAPGDWKQKLGGSFYWLLGRVSAEVHYNYISSTKEKLQ